MALVVVHVWALAPATPNALHVPQALVDEDCCVVTGTIGNLSAHTLRLKTCLGAEAHFRMEGVKVGTLGLGREGPLTRQVAAASGTITALPAARKAAP